jgi:1,4-dihydroxy-2-naphthoate octaprenyltransferase
MLFFLYPISRKDLGERIPITSLMNRPHRLKLTLLATRPWSFSMTPISVTLGNIVGISAVPFHWERYILLLTGMILVHAATNVLNDYCDFRHGLDVKGAPTTLYRRHPLVEGDFTPKSLLRLSVFCYAGGALIGAYFVAVSGWIVVVFAILGGLTSLFYTADPIAYKYRGMGEIAVFVMWGPLMMIACHYIQTGTWEQSGRVLLVSIPQGLWVALVLLANNLKDIEFDSESQVTTIGTKLGRTNTIKVYILLIAVIYGITLMEIVIGIIPVWGLLTILSLPLVAKLIVRFQREAGIPPDADPQTAQTGMLYGLLLVAAFLIPVFV